MNPFQKLAYEIRRGQVLREKVSRYAPLAMGVGGAGIGAIAGGEDNRLAGAAIGGLAGLGGAYAGRALTRRAFNNPKNFYAGESSRLDGQLLGRRPGGPFSEVRDGFDQIAVSRALRDHMQRRTDLAAKIDADTLAGLSTAGSVLGGVGGVGLGAGLSGMLSG